MDYNSLHKLSAMLPVYGPEGGNQTKLYCFDGTTEMLPLRQETVINRFASVFGINLSAQRKNTEGQINIGKYHPLWFSLDVVLFPLYTRVPHNSRDGASGYFSLTAIEGVISLERPRGERSQPGTAVYLKGGHRIEVYCGYSTVSRRMNNAQAYQQTQNTLVAGNKWESVIYR